MNKLLTLLAAAALITGSAACSKNQTNGGSNPESVAEQTTKADKSAEAKSFDNDPTETASTPEKSNFFVLSGDDVSSLNLPNDKIVVFDFNADWCVPCKNFHPTFVEAAKKFPQVMFVSVDVDANPNTFASVDGSSIPLVIVKSPYGPMQRFVGTGDLLPSEKFFKIIEDALAENPAAK